jgi:hypothetical protein
MHFLVLEAFARRWVLELTPYGASSLQVHMIVIITLYCFPLAREVPGRACCFVDASCLPQKRVPRVQYFLTT